MASQSFLATSPMKGGHRLAEAQCVVVKIGSALLVDAATGTPARNWLAALADDVAAMRARGQKVMIVSSGAIALGRRMLGLSRSATRLEEKQAAAAAGQARLMSAWEDAFARHDLPVAQALLTTDDTERRRRWLNARATLETLMNLGAIPIINENDTVATEEIRYGDNDRLAARAAQMVGADLLVLLSDIDGLHERDPRRHPDAPFIEEVMAITPEIIGMAGGAGDLGSGGMATKIEAARIAMAAGCSVVITRGTPAHPLARLSKGGQATWFTAATGPRAAYKAWIGGLLTPRGVIGIDAGAAAAVQGGKSLLAAGVITIDGPFEKGDAVRILDGAGTEIGRGLVRQDSPVIHAMRGLGQKALAERMGPDASPVVIHADDLVRT